MRIPFRAPDLADREPCRAAAERSHARENDCAFASLYLLRHKYGTQIAFSGGVLLRRYTLGFRAGSYGFPLGGDEAETLGALRALKAHAQDSGEKFSLSLLTAAQCETLRGAFPGEFRFTPCPDYTEYLYLRENLAELKGSRYHGKRNHIAQFDRAYPDAQIQPLIAENAEYAVEIAADWLKGREDPKDPSLQAEFACITEAAREFDALRLRGLLLYAEGKPVGMTMASEISDGIYDVHFEKVVPGYPHAWPKVASEMAKVLPDAQYLNREEDLGDGGMRASKQSYHPDLEQEKFLAEALP